MNLSTGTWYSLPLGDGMTSSGPAEEIRELFKPAYEAAGRPAEMAVFTLFDSEGRPQCQVTAYFSPACTALAHSLGARPCNPPARQDLGLLAGDERAWDSLFSQA